MNNIIALHSTKGNSDKVYVVGVVKRGPGLFEAIAKWGKRPPSDCTVITPSFPVKNNKMYGCGSTVYKAMCDASEIILKRLCRC